MTILAKRQPSAAAAKVIACSERGKVERAALWPGLEATSRRYISRIVPKEFSGKFGEVHLVLPHADSREKIVLVGLGEPKTWDHRKAILSIRRATTASREQGVRTLAIGIEDFAVPDTPLERIAEWAATNAHLANYEFRKYKEAPKEGWKDIAAIELTVTEPQKIAAAAKTGATIGELTNFCRDIANTPGRDMTPMELSAIAKRAGRDWGFEVNVFDRDEMKRLKMGAILGVAKGSDEEPQFITMEYHNAGNAAPIVLIGKGVTFDTGGLSIKPASSMYEMHLDMSGGAAVIAAMAAIAGLKLQANVIGLVPAIENMLSGRSYRPGDLLTSMSGKTIEVLNTDAEGRIILSDALTYAERFKPRVVIDLATLTGAAMVALGHRASALFTRDPDLSRELIEAGERSGDYVWPLPLWEEYEEEVKGTFGDVANIGKYERIGDAIAGATFLQQFAKNYPWAHIDIAPMMTSVEGQGLAKGATGVGVRLCVELIRSRFAKKP
ncbi:leucyl aminopeptidase [Candidatus Parcubacteria bacterium]|nr:leucyl aminopeptidase [Candidatus Parcubacteria bacterium]